MNCNSNTVLYILAGIVAYRAQYDVKHEPKKYFFCENI